MSDKKRLLITGGTGFIGHHMVEHFIHNTDWEIVILDSISYAGDMNRIVDSGVDLTRIKFIYHDIRAQFNDRLINEIGHIDYIIHTAAETHVENSLKDPKPFVYTNVVGTYNMLEYAKTLYQAKILKKYIQISTDEVYGPAPHDTEWKEWDRLFPSNPYSATKAGGDCLALAYAKSFNLPITVCRSMNNFGERQHPEKFIPLIMKSVIEKKIIKVHAQRNKDGGWESGSRLWLHARNHADAVFFLLSNPNDELIINIVGEREVSNLDMVGLISKFMGIEAKWEWFDFHSSRPGHDLRYALDGTKLKSLGWKMPVSFEDSLKKTVEWTLEHQKYLAW
uniref:Putative GDP-mannose 4,6-dehydratase n=1 Tax=viral metagenome TaxID=1070528 RepID=A0A6M3M4G5_9ZZZZ